MKLNESKHGFVVQRMTEVSELNATMYETYKNPFKTCMVKT